MDLPELSEDIFGSEHNSESENQEESFENVTDSDLSANVLKNEQHVESINQAKDFSSEAGSGLSADVLKNEQDSEFINETKDFGNVTESGLGTNLFENEKNPESINQAKDLEKVKESGLSVDVFENVETPEITNQADDFTNATEPVILTKDQRSVTVDSTQTKILEENENEDIVKVKNEETSSESMPIETNDPSINTLKDNFSENINVKEESEEPVKKKSKLREDDKMVPSVSKYDLYSENSEPDSESESEELQKQGLDQATQLKLHEIKTEQDDENSFENELHAEDVNQQFEKTETYKLLQEDKEDDKIEYNFEEESEKSDSEPDTDMLATLARAALQDSKKRSQHMSASGSTASTSQSGIPKKKSESWCTVGVFQTNSTIVTSYEAPSSGEDGSLVTATPEGFRIQLQPGTAYKLRVCAVNACGVSSWSDVAAFKTTLPGYPLAPSSIKISQSSEGAHLTWQPPGGDSTGILEYAVYMAVRTPSQESQPCSSNQAHLGFIRVYCGSLNRCIVTNKTLKLAHIDTTNKAAIIFRIAARNTKGYGPATQVRWLQETQTPVTAASVAN